VACRYSEGEVPDLLVQSKRNLKAALKSMRKLLKKQGFAPTQIITDKLRSYHNAFRTLGVTVIRPVRTLLQDQQRLMDLLDFANVVPSLLQRLKVKADELADKLIDGNTGHQQ